MTTQQPLFKKVLIANRGEIACRIMQSLQEMGIKTVALYSDPDKSANHVRMADEAIYLPGTKPGETYLNYDYFLPIAKELGVDGLHPGYGFLSENAKFAVACAEAGIKFIGPKPGVIHSMGDKLIAKDTMTKANVPVVPGWSGDLSTPFEQIAEQANKVGFPLLVKAAAGGGGKGMRLVDKPEELQAALEAAAREAQNAFGDSRVFLEKYVLQPRHIEFQILGDDHGNVVHLFERECSIQRRYQKIIEETPSPALTPELRAKMGQAAVSAAKAIGYTNAGTVEFILGADNEFYFLEVNTRLQVEHPVTEMVTHQDLVRLQVAVAAGQKLPFTQDDLKQDGHAIECRIYAEDPANNFMPAVGKIAVLRQPQGPNIRVDTGYAQGYEVTVHYDPMLSKLICWGRNRDEAIAKMRWALKNYVILGFRHNIAFLAEILDHPEFIKGNINTHFLTEYPISARLPEPDHMTLAAAALSDKLTSGLSNSANQNGQSSDSHSTPWELVGSWRGH